MYGKILTTALLCLVLQQTATAQGLTFDAAVRKLFTSAIGGNVYIEGTCGIYYHKIGTPIPTSDGREYHILGGYVYRFEAINKRIRCVTFEGVLIREGELYTTAGTSLPFPASADESGGEYSGDLSGHLADEYERPLLLRLRRREKMDHRSKQLCGDRPQNSGTIQRGFRYELRFIGCYGLREGKRSYPGPSDDRHGRRRCSRSLRSVRRSLAGFEPWQPR